jgi:hypothetical protein
LLVRFLQAHLPSTLLDCQYRYKLELSVYVVLAVFAAFEVYANRVTTLSQNFGRTLQEYHNRLPLIHICMRAPGESISNVVSIGVHWGRVLSPLLNNRLPLPPVRGKGKSVYGKRGGIKKSSCWRVSAR